MHVCMYASMHVCMYACMNVCRGRTYNIVRSFMILEVFVPRGQNTISLKKLVFIGNFDQRRQTPPPPVRSQRGNWQYHLLSNGTLWNRNSLLYYPSVNNLWSQWWGGNTWCYHCDLTICLLFFSRGELRDHNCRDDTAGTLSPMRTQGIFIFSVDDSPMNHPPAFTMVYATLWMSSDVQQWRL